MWCVVKYRHNFNLFYFALLKCIVILYYTMIHMEGLEKSKKSVNIPSTGIRTSKYRMLGGDGIDVTMFKTQKITPRQRWFWNRRIYWLRSFRPQNRSQRAAELLVAWRRTSRDRQVKETLTQSLCHGRAYRIKRGSVLCLGVIWIFCMAFVLVNVW